MKYKNKLKQLTDVTMQAHPQIRHGCLLDAVSQLGNAGSHDLIDGVPANAGKVGVLQLL